MKALKIILGILVALIAIYLILCLVGPSKVEAERTATIEAPASLVYKNISDFRKWEAWSPWKEKDTSMTLTYGENTVGVGGNYSWTSEESGDGQMEILEAEAPVSMKTKIQFADWEGYSYGSWKLVSQETGATEVSWGMTSDAPVPFIFRGLMVLMGMQGSIEKDFDRGLSNLKGVVEKQFAELPTAYRGFEVKAAQFPGGSYVVIRDEVEMANMASFMAQSYGSIMALLQANAAQPSGPPASFYFTWDEANQKTEMAAAMPVSGPVNMGENVEQIDLPAGPCLEIDYYGDYNGIGEAHFAIDEYMADRGLQAKMPVMELYITDPMSEPDTSKWLTKVVYPLEK